MSKLFTCSRPQNQTGGNSIGVALGQQEDQLAGCVLEASWEGFMGEAGFEMDSLQAEERRRLPFPSRKVSLA